MSRRKPEARCNECLMRFEDCLCKEAFILKNSLKEIQTSFLLLMHHKEYRLPTNTGRLMQLAWPQVEIILRGQEGRVVDVESALIDEYRNLLMYPSEDAVALDEEFFKKNKGPFQLIVPDGNWRQASKVAKREKSLNSIQKVFLPEARATEYKLRHEPKEGGLATFEAMARFVGLAEGLELEERLMDLFRLKVQRTLKSRGKV